jgi:hypothetical protein
MRKKRTYFFLSGLTILFLSFTFGTNSDEGNLIGFLHDIDGSSPLLGAVIKLKNIYTDELYTSSEADDYGIARIKSVKPGLYVYGVSTKNGNYNSNEVLGISGGKTAKVSISLKNFNTKEQKAVQELTSDLKRKGESLIGRVDRFYSNSRRADVEIIKGMVKNGDLLHIVGVDDNVDFKIKTKNLMKDGVNCDKVFVTETASIPFNKEARKGNLVYILSKKGMAPLFLIPLGAATAVGTGFVKYSSTDVHEASTYK